MIAIVLLGMAFIGYRVMNRLDGFLNGIHR